MAGALDRYNAVNFLVAEASSITTAHHRGSGSVQSFGYIILLT